MPVVTIIPSGRRIIIQPGTTLLAAVLDNDLAWPHTCGGKAQCTTCAYILIKGHENVSPMNRLEEFQLAARKGHHVIRQRMRLACQTVVKGDVTVQKSLMEL